MKCQVWKSCKDYKKENVTCNEHGGMKSKKGKQVYCGRLRELLEKQKK